MMRKIGATIALVLLAPTPFDPCTKYEPLKAVLYIATLDNDVILVCSKAIPAALIGCTFQPTGMLSNEP